MAMAGRNQVQTRHRGGEILRTFEEGDHCNETFVPGVTFPLGEHDGILGMCFHVFRVSVE